MAGYIGAKVGTVTGNAADIKGDISSTDTSPDLTLKNTTQEDTDGGREGTITFKGEQSGGEESTLAQIQSSHDGTADDQKGDLIFKTNDGSDNDAPTERMRIDSAGNVLIGGATFDTGDFSGSANGINVFDASNPILNLVETTGNTSFYIAKSTSAAFIGTADAQPIRFSTSDTERVRIDSSGKVGIGNTSPPEFLTIGDATADGASRIQFFSTTNGVNTIHFGDGASAAAYRGYIQYAHSNDSLVFGASAADRVRIDSDGLKFGSDSAAANALSDYEEGTWAPTSNGAAGVSNPSTVRGAVYTRVGNLVTLNAEFVLPTNSNSSQCNIGGLPYPTSNASVYRDMGNAAANVGFGLISYVVNNDSKFGLYNDENYGAVSYASLSGKTIVVNITYKTDS